MPNIKALGIAVSDKKIFMFPYISLCKTCESKGGPIWPLGYYLKTLGRDLLDDATYQKSRLQTFWFSDKISSCVPLEAFVKHVTPRMGPFWAPVA